MMPSVANFINAVVRVVVVGGAGIGLWMAFGWLLHVLGYRDDNP